MRLIDADAAKKVLESKSDMATGTPKKVFAHVVKMLDLLTTIEAEPVRHGSWVIKTHDDGYGEYQVKHCPDCDRGLPVEYDADYCPKCGAKMRGTTDE